MLITSFDTIINRFLRRVEKDSNFFTHYNLTESESIELIHEQSKGYLYDAIDLLISRCTPQVDFYDYDRELEVFNFDLTPFEINMLSSLMFQVHMERDFSLLSAFRVRMTPSDLNVFSPAQERSSFVSLYEKIKRENEITISKYVSTDRISQKYLSIDHSKYDYS